jgi:DNA-binding CsgD family transcriptional regulator
MKVPKAMWNLLEAPSMRALVDDALGDLSEELGASLSVYYRMAALGVDGQSPRRMTSPMPLYTARYAERCPLQAAKRAHNPEVAVMSDLITASDASRSEVICDFFRPFRIERHLTVRLSAVPYGATGCSGIVFCRPASDPPWRERDVRTLRRLRPLLSSVFAYAQRSEEAAATMARQNALAAVLDRVEGAPLILLDRDLRLVFRSSSFDEALLVAIARRDSSASRLRQAAGRLLGVDRSGGRTAPEDSIAVDGLAGVGARLELSRLDVEGQPFVLCRLMFPASSAGEGDIARVAARHDLSRAEAAVLAVLAEGLSDREIGRRLFISAGTVHSHLKRIYQKMNVRSRAEAIVCVTRAGASPE